MPFIPAISTEKCHFIWLKHANNGAHFLRKSLIFIKWRMSRLSPVDTQSSQKENPGLAPGFLFLPL